MSSADQYSVVFEGVIRQGFERRTVAITLAQKLHLNGEQVKQLFAGGKHTLKRTASEEEAKQVVMLLAKIGAVSRIEKSSPETAAARPAAQPAPAAAPAKPKPSKRKPSRQLLPYTPLKNKALFQPLLFLAVCTEAVLTVVYFLLLLLAVYFSMFSLWASPTSNFPVLMLILQFGSIPLMILVLLLLAKPLLSLRPRPYRGIPVPEEHETDLHMFVQDVCDRLRVTAPCEIRLNNDVALTFRHKGLRGFQRDEFVMTLGVPLLAALKTNQLAALLVRELLSFRHQHYPRTGFLLMASHRWLHAALYEEDGFDLGLKRWQEQGRLSPGTVSKIQGLLSFSRKLMSPRLAISRVLEQRLVHRIVADADRKAAALAGREGLSHALEQRRLLAYTAEEMIPVLKKQWLDKGTLPDDLVQLTLHKAREYPVSVHSMLRIRREQEKVATGDIIPTDAQRFMRLHRPQSLPGYACVSPANTLLRYFSKLAATMTVRYYHNRLNIPVTPDKLTHITLKGSPEEQLNNLLDGYFNGVLHLMQPLHLQVATQEINDKAMAKAEWREALGKITDNQVKAQRDFVMHATNEKQLAENSMHEVLYRAELWSQLGESKMNKEEFETFLVQCREIEREHEETHLKVAANMRPYAQRLGASLALYLLETGNVEAEKHAREVGGLITIYNRIETVLPKLRELKLHSSLLNVLLSYQNSDRPSPLLDRIVEEAADSREQLTAIKVALKDLPNPFPAPRGGKKLMDYLLLESYHDETPEGDYDRANDVIVRLTMIQKQILVRLITLAREMEKQLA